MKQEILTVPKDKEAVLRRYETFCERLELMPVRSFSQFQESVKACHISGSVSAALQHAGLMSNDGGVVTFRPPLVGLLNQKQWDASALLMLEKVRVYTRERRLIKEAKDMRVLRASTVAALPPIPKQGEVATLFPADNGEKNAAGQEIGKFILNPEDLQPLPILDFTLSTKAGDLIVATCRKYNLTPSQVLERIIRDYYGVKSERP